MTKEGRIVVGIGLVLLCGLLHYFTKASFFIFLSGFFTNIIIRGLLMEGI